jgi:glycosyltransferase involved in cell wall biosynthesis
MKIAMIGPFGLQPKATLKSRALPMAKALVARGHSVTLLIPPWDYPADAGREWEEEKVHIINLLLPPRWPLVFHVLLAVRLVRRALDLKPDVIHFFKPKAYSGLTHFFVWWLRRGGWASKSISPQVRLVVDEDDWEQAWNSVEAYSPIQRRFFTWQERWGLTHADAVVVASRTLAGLVQELGVSAERTFYVPNGMGVSPAPAGEQPDADQDPAEAAQIVRMLWELDGFSVVMLYTRFVEFRLERVVDVLRQVVAREPQTKLLVVGEGLFGEESSLDDMLQSAGLSEHAVFTGWVEAGHLSSYFAACDVAIFPFDDTLINRTKCSAKLTDLLAAGLPVVADAVGQNLEYIADGESGLLIPPGDNVAFAEGVVRLLADPGLRARLGMAAARRMRERFAWPNLAREVERAYQ